ncbi:hypothetical protein FB451DRAFT_1364418 [Mycena latifolia]|nr:hypothetical protein FB451DRAFT_1364418 [Mycena latifolia]
MSVAQLATPELSETFDWNPPSLIQSPESSSLCPELTVPPRAFYNKHLDENLLRHVKPMALLANDISNVPSEHLASISTRGLSLPLPSESIPQSSRPAEGATFVDAIDVATFYNYHFHYLPRPGNQPPPHAKGTRLGANNYLVMARLLSHPYLASSQFLAILEYIYRAGVRHHDIRPENLMITETGHAAIIDFDRADLSPTAGQKRREMERLSELLNGSYYHDPSMGSPATTWDSANKEE